MTSTTTTFGAHRVSSVLARCLTAIAAIFCLSLGVAHAGFIGSDLVMVHMSDSQGHSASAGIPNPFANLPPQAQVPQRVQEMIAERFPIEDGNTVLGWVDSLGATLDGDPVAGINFMVTAGGSDVTVLVSSANVAFAALNNPAASAEAEITLTDNGGAAATIETVNGNAGLFKAVYNDSLEYASLLGNSSVGGGAVTFSDDINGPIAGSVDKIKAQFAFRLSAGDSASGKGTFTVVPIPEPTSAALATCGCVALILTRGRRR